MQHERMGQMIVNFEFFDEDPIENVITNLNYRIDKTVFFCYEGLPKVRQSQVADFLKTVCGAKEVEFCAVDSIDLNAIVDAISDKVDEELGADNQIFFDLTGGESLPLVAFGIVAKELMAPMHMYNVRSGEMYEYGYDDALLLSQAAEYDPLYLNLDEFISLYGGEVNYRLHKDVKNAESQEDAVDIENTWKIYSKYSEKWSPYCVLLRKFVPDASLCAVMDDSQMIKEAQKLKNIGSTNAFKKFLDECEELDLIRTISKENGVRKFRYKTEQIKNYFWDSGSILEMYAFLQEARKEDINDCRVGVHIDWDGVIHKATEEDVLNEIDIMTICNNLPTFISCKIGNVDQMALYELEAVANRFGGKYAKKVLVTAKDLSQAHLLRAKEMGIEVRKME